MKVSVLVSLATAVLPLTAAGVAIAEQSKRQVGLGYELFLGTWRGYEVCSGIPTPCQFANTWVSPYPEDVCDTADTGSALPNPPGGVPTDWCDIEFGDPDFCEGHLLKMIQQEDQDCGRNGGRVNIGERYASLVDVDVDASKVVGTCFLDNTVDGTYCPYFSGSRVMNSHVRCVYDYAPGVCGGFETIPPRT